MAGRRPRNARNGPSKERLSREMRRSKMTLFIQQVEKEAQERVNELEAKTESLLTTVDKVFRVELMKKPPSLQSTLIGELLSSEEVSASEASIAAMSESLVMPQPLKRIPSKKAKSTESPPVQSASGQRASKRGKGPKRIRTLVGSNSTGNLRGSSVTAGRAQSGLQGHTASSQKKPKLRSVVSAGDMHCAIAGATAHVTVTTAQGQTVSFCEETKDDINCDLLDDMAWKQIDKIVSMLDELTQRKRDS
ncbi:borealin-2 [Salarias fasciatus]|uniref:borealin-2 n=1 Tax=Salarias fasciatus TaxID=181472 RepID=UPI001176A4D7|nr:borealin-2-like [Salarias fasciatus]